MAQEPWKVLVRQRLQEAAGCCARAHGVIAGVLGHLARQMLENDAPTWRDWVPRADSMLADASGDLAVAASLMEAARFIALRGAAASQAAPLRSINEVPDEGVRIALAQLQDARDLAEAASDLVDLCRAHLCAARLMLDRLHLPGLVSFVNVKRVSASDDLDDARKIEQESTSLLHEALKRLLR